MSAGGPAWYSIVAVSFFLCEFNPIGAIGIAARLKDPYRSPLEWGLTATSFLLALVGFMLTERIALAERSRRPLEISSIIAIAAGLIPAVVGTAMPAIIMWPIAAMFLLIGAAGLRAGRKLSPPAALAGSPAPADSKSFWLGDQAAPAPEPAAPPVATAETPPRKRRRRRRRRRSAASQRRRRHSRSSP